MNAQKTPQNALEDIKVNLKLNLATLWASFMFLYIYVDYFALYMPGKIEDILKGRVFVFDIIQGFLLAAPASVTIPALRIFLSVVVFGAVVEVVLLCLIIRYAWKWPRIET